MAGFIEIDTATYGKILVNLERAHAVILSPDLAQIRFSDTEAYDFSTDDIAKVKAAIARLSLIRP